MAEAEGGDPVFCAAVPLGGYWRHGRGRRYDDEANVPDNPRAFNNAAWWRKLVILFAGAFTNILVAIVTMIITVTIIGMPVNTLSKVSPDGPAAQAGLRQGDKIVSVQGEDVHSWSDTMSVLNREDGKRPIKVEVLRSGKTREYSVTPVASEKEPGRYVIGIEAAVSHNVFQGNLLRNSYHLEGECRHVSGPWTDVQQRSFSGRRGRSSRSCINR